MAALTTMIVYDAHTIVLPNNGKWQNKAKLAWRNQKY